MATATKKDLTIRDAGSGEVAFSVGRHVAYGTLDVATQDCSLIHAPTQADMDAVAAVVDACDWDDLRAADQR